jgi:large subunit ribosomal protein L4
MASIAVKNSSGKAAGNVDVADELFAVEPNVPVMHQVVTAQLAGRRAGTQSTKTRAEVSGTGKKPFNQKGTGGARQGSTRAPHFKGGGIAHGPKPRKYTQRTPRKMIRLALASALSDRNSSGHVIVIESWGLTTPSTKDALKALTALGVEGRVMVVVSPSEEIAIKSFRNVPEVQLTLVGELNAYDVLCNDWIVFSKDSLPIAKEAK